MAMAINYPLADVNSPDSHRSPRNQAAEGLGLESFMSGAEGHCPSGVSNPQVVASGECTYTDGSHGIHGT